MKTIIVPLDFSMESLSGLNLAIMLAKKTGAGIQLVHVIAKNENSGEEQTEKQQNVAKSKFEALIKTYKSKDSSVPNLAYLIKQGKIFKEVTDLGDQFEDSAIVLSTYGESGFEELFIGGNAYKITSHSRIPVFTVRRNKTTPTFDKIVLPLDITFETREKVPYTVTLAKLFGSEIHLVTIKSTDSESIEKKLAEYAKQVESYLSYQKVPYKTLHLKGENLTDITLDYARSINADLVSIMTEQEKSVSNLLLGSYAHQMINKALMPVLSFPNYQVRLVSEDIWSLGEFNARESN